MNYRLGIVLSLAALLPMAAAANAFFFSTGNPDGLAATLSQPAAPGVIQTETADDFILTQGTRITSATFVGLIPIGVSLNSLHPGY